MTTNQVRLAHSTVTVSSKTAVRQYNEYELPFGFSPSGEEQPCPKCVVCCEKPAKQTTTSLRVRDTFNRQT
jgi:hypothetical protein